MPTDMLTDIRVRSYNVGFGDCFLVSFPDGEKNRHILIDFGCAPGQSQVAFGSIVENIYEETEGHLDLVVVTHEHLDHLNGFLDQRKAFKKFQIDCVWMNVTSKPGYLDDDPESTLANLRTMANTFRDWMSESNVKIAPSFETLILNNLCSDSQIDSIRNLVEDKKDVRYLHRGKDDFGSPFSDNVSVEVLSPLESFEDYFDGNDDPDLYDKIQSLEKVKDRLESRLDCQNEAKHVMFPSNVFKNVTCVKVPKNLSHRDWHLLRSKNPGFGVSELRALDTAVNNTSLVLLFTINGKKLLFPGDAEWASWDWMRYCDRCIESDIVHENCSGCADRVKAFQSVDFLKLSQNGSKAGTPTDIFDQLKPSAKIMVSTQAGVYGTKNRIPDIPLLNMLRETHGDNLIINEPINGPLWIDAKL